ncbi:MAG: hypothetical protein V7K50_25735 [Nostoc sp.]|uniref:hypothetical protein n=1 Tax=Nostoc sp. TaxID=1180 RepID=UPI002FF9C405
MATDALPNRGFKPRWFLSVAVGAASRREGLKWLLHVDCSFLNPLIYDNLLKAFSRLALTLG